MDFLIISVDVLLLAFGSDPGLSLVDKGFNGGRKEMLYTVCNNVRSDVVWYEQRKFCEKVVLCILYFSLTPSRDERVSSRNYPCTN